MSDAITFKCRIGRMKEKGKIVWVPLRFVKFFEEDTYVEVSIRKLK